MNIIHIHLLIIAGAVAVFSLLEMLFSFFLIRFMFNSGFLMHKSIIEDMISTGKFETGKIYQLENCRFRFISNNELIFVRKTGFHDKSLNFTPLLKGSIEFSNNRISTSFRLPLGIILTELLAVIAAIMLIPQLLKDTIVIIEQPFIIISLIGITAVSVFIYIDYSKARKRIDSISNEIVEYLKRA